MYLQQYMLHLLYVQDDNETTDRTVLWVFKYAVYEFSREDVTSIDFQPLSLLFDCTA
jgi:hypothetical protein